VHQAQKFLASEYGMSNMQFALRTARARQAAENTIQSWVDSSPQANKGMIEVFSVVRPGQKLSKAQKWLNKTRPTAHALHHALLHENPDQILTANLSHDKTRPSQHQHLQHGPAYLKMAGLSGQEDVNDMAKFDGYMSEQDFVQLLTNKQVLLHAPQSSSPAQSSSPCGLLQSSSPAQTAEEAASAASAASAAAEDGKQEDGKQEPKYLGIEANQRTSSYWEYVDFVEVPANLDVLSEDTAAFYSQAISQNASRWFSVPYQTFIKIANSMPDPAPKILFVWSTGRCGSTIVSQLLHTHEKVAASLSEPPAVAALNRLVIAPHSNPHDNDTWIRCMLKMLLKNWTSKEEVVCIKPHPVAIQAVEAIKAAMPATIHTFLYRNSAPNVESWHALLCKDASTPGQRGLPRDYFRIVPRHLKDPFATNDYLSPILKPKAHLHVFYCTIMYYAIQLIKRGFLSKTFKYEQLVARPHAVLSKLLEHAGMHFEETPASRQRTLQAMGKDSQHLGKPYVPKPVYHYTPEEEDDFTPCHERFGISVLYHSSKLEGLGDINLGNALI